MDEKKKAVTEAEKCRFIFGQIEYVYQYKVLNAKNDAELQAGIKEFRFTHTEASSMFKKMFDDGMELMLQETLKNIHDEKKKYNIRPHINHTTSAFIKLMLDLEKREIKL